MVDKRDKLIKFLTLFFTICFVYMVFVFAGQAYKAQDLENAVSDQSYGWRVEGQEETVYFGQKIDLQSNTVVLSRPVGEGLISGKSLIFYTQDTAVDIFFDRTSIYSYRVNPSGQTGIQIADWQWHVVNIPKNAKADSDIVIRLSYQHPKDYGRLPQLYGSTAADFFDKTLRDSLLSIMICGLLLVLFIGTLIHVLFNRKLFSNAKDVLYFGVYTALACFFLSTRIPWVSWVFNDGYFLSTMNYFLRVTMFLPILGWGAQIKDTRHPNLFWGIYSAMLLYVTCLGLMYILGMGTFVGSYRFQNIMGILLGTMFFVALIDDKRHNKISRSYSVVSILLVMHIATLVDYYLTVYGGNSNGTSIWGVITLVSISILIYQASASLARQYNESLMAKRYHFLSTMDILTGLKNRNSFEKTMESLKDPVGAGVILMDVNNLKEINDTMGHKNGDELLVIISEEIKKAFQEGFECFRIGGDEFAILFQNISGDGVDDQLWNFESKLRRRQLEVDFPLSVATGYAIFDENMDKSMEDVIHRADKNMYFKKVTMKM